MKPFQQALAYSTIQDRVATVTIYDSIGVDDDGKGVKGAWIAEAIAYLSSYNDVDLIKVRINSPGGSVIDGMVILAAIACCKKPVDTYCDGIAASMAAIIMQAGRKRYMADAGLLMLHAPYIPNEDGSEDPSIAYIKNSLATILKKRSGMTDDMVESFLSETDKWFDASEAINANLVDEVFELVNKAEVPKREPVAAYAAFAKVINKAQPTNVHMNKMEKVAAALKLPSDSAEEAILVAVNGLQTAYSESAKNLADVSAKLADAEKKLTELEAAAKDAEIEQILDKAVKEGRLAATAVDPFRAMAKANLEATKVAIEALPVNKSAAHVGGGDDKSDKSLAQIPGASATAHAMAEIQAKNSKKVV